VTSSDTTSARAADVNVYRTLFLCTLRQETAFSFGGTDQQSLADMGLARDGDGCLVFRGSSLAGALLATARTFLTVHDEISRDAKKGSDLAQPTSLWHFDHAHPWRNGAPDKTMVTLIESRAHSAHRHDTRTADGGGYFDQEILPRGVQWRFLLDVRHLPGNPAPGRRAAAQAALALREWQRRRCWLGRHVARGLGWMQLEDCCIVELPRSEESIDAWPTARPSDLVERYDWVRQMSTMLGGATCLDSQNALDDYLAQHGNESHAGPIEPTRAYVRWPLRIEVGEYRPDGKGKGYGLDALSLLGHGGNVVEAASLEKHFIRAHEQSWASFTGAYSPDNQLAMSCDLAAATPAPVLPGSSIAGALRHHLARSLRAAGQAALDPVTGQHYGPRPASGTTGEARANGNEAGVPGSRTATASVPSADPSTELFGGLGEGRHPSRLLISDAHLAHDAEETWRLALLEKVAIDEFRQSAFESAKFNRLAVLAGAWSLTMVQEIRSPLQDDVAQPSNAEAWQSHVKQCTAPTRDLLSAAAMRRIGLGGGEFSAYGHVPIECDGQVEWAMAGMPWQAWPPAGAGLPNEEERP
jgi:CRISPR/Cas system CSM-associated protein Csm3 (group 7 of RAMP superfamily)